MKDERLKKYRDKRDLERSPEPDRGRSRSSRGPLFVIQEHDAQNLHYDFRLEVDGVLKSWTIPKGPSTDPSEKRLAIPTEDHPLEYADFEGIIPEGEYGAGAVIVWDKGTYQNQSKKDGRALTMQKAYRKGHIRVRLNGKKLTGGFALVRFREDGEGQWLLVKEDDDGADARRNPVSTERKSVLSGRTITDLKEEGS
ncbi:MAG: DNA polymerase ligase N-terminal domain-containing protein [Acholeplasmataceae bacterium]